MPLNPTNDEIGEYVYKTQNSIKNNELWDVMKLGEIQDERNTQNTASIGFYGSAGK